MKKFMFKVFNSVIMYVNRYNIQITYIIFYIQEIEKIAPYM